MKLPNRKKTIQINLSPLYGEVEMDNIQKTAQRGISIQVRNRNYGTYCGHLIFGSDVVAEIIKEMKK